MHKAVSPNPVAAMLEIGREPLSPLSKARSFTCPVEGLVSRQKNSKLARSTSSRNCSSLSLPIVAGAEKEFLVELLQPSHTPAPARAPTRSNSLRVTLCSRAIDE